VHKGDFDVVLVYTASNYGVFPHCWAQDLRRDTLVFAPAAGVPVGTPGA
jgi:hypothetical protein